MITEFVPKVAVIVLLVLTLNAEEAAALGLGPVDVAAEVTVSGEYDNNCHLNRKGEEEACPTSRLGPKIEASAPLGINSLDLSYSGDYRLGETNTNTQNHSLKMDLRLRPGRRLRGRVSNTFSLIGDDRENREDIDRPDYWRDLARGAMSYLQGKRGRYTLSYEHEVQRHFGRYGHRNSDRDRVELDAKYLFGRELWGTANVGFNNTYLPLPDPPDPPDPNDPKYQAYLLHLREVLLRREKNYVATVGAKWKGPYRFTLSGAVGYELVDYSEDYLDSQTGEICSGPDTTCIERDLNTVVVHGGIRSKLNEMFTVGAGAGTWAKAGVTADAFVDFVPSERTSLKLKYSRNADRSWFTGNPFYIYDRVGLSIKVIFGEGIILSPQVSYTHTTYPRAVDDEHRVDNSFGTGTTFAYSLHQWCKIGAYYHYLARFTNATVTGEEEEELSANIAGHRGGLSVTFAMD